MIYAMASPQGCYDKYREMLKEINFSKSDILFVLGDVVDGGEKGIDILFDMMMHENIFPILGEHDLVAYEIMSGIEKETLRDISAPLSDYLAERCQGWMDGGGEPTLLSFARLQDEDKQVLLEYLEEFSMYEEAEAGGVQYVLAHNIPTEFQSGESLDDYGAEDVLTGEADFDKEYFPGKILITSHKHTGKEGKIYKNKHNIMLDCGACMSGRLAAYCLDTKEEFYV